MAEGVNEEENAAEEDIPLLGRKSQENGQNGDGARRGNKAE